MFYALKAYKNDHGDFRLSRQSKRHKELALWIGVQRRAYTKGKLSADRTARLEALGFEWDPRDSLWERMFQILLTYKKEHGHCSVPAVYKSFRSFGNWVVNQRSFYKKGKLSTDRISKLDALGFEWKVR